MPLSLARAHGTTALAARYYRVGRGCKKLHPPLLPRGSGTSLMGHGSAAPGERYYHGHLRYYRAAARYYRWCLRYYRSPGSSTTASHHSSQKQGWRKLQGARERRGLGRNVYVVIPPNLSDADPLLIVRLSYDSNPPKRNVEKTSSSSVFEGQPRLVPSR